MSFWMVSRERNMVIIAAVMRPVVRANIVDLNVVTIKGTKHLETVIARQSQK